MTKLSVSELCIYPIKSARGITLDSMELYKKGPECDRRWMVIDANGTFITQRKVPRMSLIVTELINGVLYMSADGFSRCQIPSGGFELHSSTVWGDQVKGEDCGNEAAQWISDFIGKNARLIYMTDDYSRPVDTNFAKQKESVGFADGYPLLITTQASLDDFNAKLNDTEIGSIGMNRFRPNIVITGNGAWAEDQWQTITIGGIEISLVKPCSRCIMPSIDPDTAKKQMSVNQALLEHRRRGKQTYFGQNGLYNSLGTIAVGDNVSILK